MVNHFFNANFVGQAHGFSHCFPPEKLQRTCMPLDAFHLKRLAVELDSAIAHGKINKITQSSKDELTLYIYTKGKVVKLLFSTNATFARVCLTNVEKEPLPVAPNFCMLLRKHLLGGEILSVFWKSPSIVRGTFRPVIGCSTPKSWASIPT